MLNFLKELVIEYAEEYSKTEKFKRILLALLLGILAYIIIDKWCLPFINWYIDTAHCHNHFGYSGVSVVWYALFAGLPILCAIVIGSFTVPIGYKGLIQKQFPPKGFKVFKPTKIIRGWKSSLMSVIQLLIPIVFIVLSIWGYFQVDKMPSKAPQTAASDKFPLLPFGGEDQKNTCVK